MDLIAIKTRIGTIPLALHLVTAIIIIRRGSCAIPNRRVPIIALAYRNRNNSR